MSSSPWWKPLPLIFSCFGCLFSVLLNVWRWILNKKCCKNNNNNNNYYYCCCYEGNKSLINKIEEGNEEEKQLKIFANQPLLHLCSPLKLIEENPPLPSIENGRIHSSKEDLKIISQKELEETKSLDRNLFSIKWNKRLNNSSTKLNCNNKNIRPTLEKRKENINGDYDSPSIALLDPCTSTSSSPAIQNSNSSHSSVPQRLACFLSKRLKRTKSFPKIQSALSRDKLSSGVGSEQLLLIKTSLGSNALRTDQQQQQQRNHQPLSLYLPVGPTEEKLKSSRSYESLLLLNQTANNNLQKSPSESENKMLLQPFPFDNKQQLKQPQQFPNNLSSPLETNIENNEGYINGYWSNK